MAPTKIDVEIRTRSLGIALTRKKDQEVVAKALAASGGDWSAATRRLEGTLTTKTLHRVDLANSLADWTGDHASIIAPLLSRPGIQSIRDVASTLDADSIAALVKSDEVPKEFRTGAPKKRVAAFASSLQTRLFTLEPSAVLQRMAQAFELPIADSNVRTGVATFLDNQPDFNIRTTSIHTALAQADAFKNIPAEHRTAVAEQLKTLQRVQAISPAPKAVTALMKAGITSAMQVAAIPESTFLKTHARTLGTEVARQVHANAVSSQIRNEHALAALRETVKGSGIALIDGGQTREARLALVAQVADAHAVPLNLSTLFGSLDHCECDDCLSVYSPAAYFVELLQFLRNNSLGPDPSTGSSTNPNIHPGIAGTPLEKLFRRRPDLGCLELTCENTFTVLPYIDLANEVMESFVVHLAEYHKDVNVPKQATLEAFNVEDETTSELLAIPQHVDYEAYCILKSAVYPFTLPYHQPIDATRIFLDYLGTSRVELLDTFRTPTETSSGPPLTPAETGELATLHRAVIDRAVDAESLGMTQEEVIILTHEAFWPKRYFELTQGKTFSDADYEKNIGVRQVCEYYGYTAPPGGSCDADLLSLDETDQVGLTFVKKQFLPRTGIAYVDLVELLKTQFVNPNFPQGEGLEILESIRFSYRYLQTLVDGSSKDPQVRFAALIKFLETEQPKVPVFLERLHPDPCKPRSTDPCSDAMADFKAWVFCYFDRIGQLIVLESGEGPRLPVSGDVVFGGKQIGTMDAFGLIRDRRGAIIGNVTATGGVVDRNGKPFAEVFGGDGEIMVRDAAGNTVAFIRRQGLEGLRQNPIAWLPARDTCDLDKVRLVHLDGSPLTLGEYDRMQRFIRLWRRMGWAIDEVDAALAGMRSSSGGGSGSGIPGGAAPGKVVSAGSADGSVGFDAFADDCVPGDGGTSCGADGNGGTQGGCPDPLEVDGTMSPAFLHQLRAITLLLDRTGLPLPQLLAFWADIGTAGEKSLYRKLFLTHNLLGIDTVFAADLHGNYLTQPATITDHIPVLMAALRVKADDLATLMRVLPVADSLTLSNVSLLYRWAALAKIVHVRIAQIEDLVALFGDPFTNAWETLDFLDTWGSMEDAGFTFRQLDYAILGRDDPLRPLAPSQRTILQVAKTLFDGLNAIDHDHPDLVAGHEADATVDLVRAKAALLFEADVVEQIIALLQGTTVYTTNAPVGLTIAIPPGDSLLGKLKYSQQTTATPPTAAIQVTGILTAAEVTRAVALSAHPNWPSAIDRVGKQAKNVFNDVLFGIFPDTVEATKRLLAGDYANPDDADDPANTAPDKRFYFLQQFLPFLRERLSQRLVTSTCARVVGLADEITSELLSNTLVVGTPPQTAMAVLESLKTPPAAAPAGWDGFLIPSADADFTFVAIGDTQPPDIVLDGKNIAFTVQQEDPSNVWSSDPTSPTRLRSGKLYRLEVTDRPAGEILWKTSTSPSTKIPSASLLPDYSSDAASAVMIALRRAALLVDGFGLGVDEIAWLRDHAIDFDGFDFNAITLAHWKRAQAYANLRDALPVVDATLLGLFAWANRADADPAELATRIAAVTGWNENTIDQLIAPSTKVAAEHFDLARVAAFRNEVALVQLRRAVTVADKIAVDVDRLFEWAKPGSKFWACHQIAEDIRKATRARFDQDDWEQIVKPLNDRLREDQKNALISYLLVQPDLIDWGVVDADSLFEFFLIDVQMDACMETSRIKQAISSVQLFIQRCLLGLEEQQVGGVEVGVRNDDIDRVRWETIEQYRLWEVPKKLFLYPENWLRSDLRDDKSPAFTSLEAALLQKDISLATIEDALKAFVYQVDEIANLKVIAFHAEQAQDNAGNLMVDSTGHPIYRRLHVFGRTRNAPYFFYYRRYDLDEESWYAWEKMSVDIPSYDLEVDQGDHVASQNNGSYLIPVVWNGRLLVFFPQLQKKTASRTSTIGGRVIKSIGDDKVDDQQPVEYWEIKMGWSEQRNGKWTPKQLSTQAFYDSPGAPPFVTPISGIDQFRFAPRIVTGSAASVLIEVFKRDGTGQIFEFTGSHLSASATISIEIPAAAEFQVSKVTHEIHSLQRVDSAPPPLATTEPFFALAEEGSTVQIDGKQQRVNHPFVRDLVGRLEIGGIDGFFDYFAHDIPDDSATVPHKVEAFGGTAAPTVYGELKRPNSLLNWEMAFYAPMSFVDALVAASKFEEAVTMCHYVLDPFAAGAPGDVKRFWQFPPFKEVDTTDVLETIFLGLKPGQPDALINEWRNKPFQPHVVARGRPSAYMKWVAMTYIRVLIKWGDYLYRQDTIESINEATQKYVLASHSYGPVGQTIPKRGTVRPATYNLLLDRWDAFGNAMVELELAFPFSNQTPLVLGSSNGVTGLANVFGFATTLYFCIPDNPELTALRATIDDRLFKIRHCENIEGVFRKLPLFEPPIDPALLVEAAAQGLSLSSVLNDLNTPMPNYRVQYLLQKALELCNELKSLGGAFFAAKERQDSEALARLRAAHETGIQNLVMEVRTQQLAEAQAALDALEQSRRGPVYRMQHQLNLIGEDLGKVPDEDVDFSELPDPIETPIDDSGLKLIAYEKEEMDKADLSADLQLAAGVTETLAGILYAIPTASADVKPIGIGVGVAFGGINLGQLTHAVTEGLRIGAGHLQSQSNSAQRKAGFLRQLQDRILQANSAGYEIKNIDRQILTQRIRIGIAEQEITNQQQQIDNALEVEDFLRNKYVNEDRCAYQVNQLSTLCYQTYTALYDIASRVEKAFRFERGVTTSFIQFGYWDPAYDGMLAGERMYVGLKQLEAAYQEKRGYDFEIVKNVSLQQLDPLALVQLRETGQCEFSLPEMLFDMGFPGQYQRRIRSVALTFACQVGPLTSINCVLRLREHKFRVSAEVKGKGDYPERTDETDDRFVTVNVPITAIAVSGGQNDSGVFELNFKDERYVPFEGAGAISKWTLELPTRFREHDYQTFTDVVMTVRYVATDATGALQAAAEDAVDDYVKANVELSRNQGLFALFDLRSDFPNEWYQSTQLAPGATGRVIALGDVVARLPLFTKGTPPNKIRATDVFVFTPAALPPAAVSLDQAGSPFPLSSSVKVGTLNAFAATEIDCPLTDWKIDISVTTPVDRMWVVVRYALG